MNKFIQIVWFKRDLRIHDHRPLFEASKTGYPVLPIYIVEPELWRQPFMSRRQWCFVHDCLQELREDCSRLGQPLIIRVGSALDVFRNLNSKFTIQNLWAHEETGHIWSFKRDTSIRDWCKKSGITFVEFPSNGVVRGLKNRDKWQDIRQTRLSKPEVPVPKSLNQALNFPEGEIPSKNSAIFGPSDVCKVQFGGRKEALNIISSFISNRGNSYLKNISSPQKSSNSCSRLSPHLALGTVSVKEVITQIRSFSNTSEDKMGLSKINSKAFLSRLAWRCHFIQKLEDMPDLESRCMHQHFEGIRTGHNQKWLTAWKLGKTGYPYIDACMRSLICEGWLNFRARALLVSFASYHLWLDWRETANYLASLFTDFEPGIHFSQMQMQSGVTGINAIRIYNPVIQSRQNDPSGNFIKKWIPELKHLNNNQLHEPWLFEPENMDSSPKSITREYPKPIIDHLLEYKNAKNKLSLIKKNKEFRSLAQEVYKKLGSRTKNQARRKLTQKLDPKNQLLFNF